MDRAGEDVSGLAAAACLAAAALLFFTGANDVANALGTSVGSRALTPAQAARVAAVCELLGAAVVGGSVAATLGDGVVHKCAFRGPVAYAGAMLSALVGAALWIGVATRYALPVSSTHAVVGAVVACGLLDGGPDAVGGGKVALTAASWVVSPLLGGAIAGAGYWGVRRGVLDAARPEARAERLAPLLVGGTAATLVLFVLLGAPKAVRPAWPWWVFLLVFAALLATLTGLAAWRLVPWLKRRMARQDRAAIRRRASSVASAASAASGASGAGGAAESAVTAVTAGGEAHSGHVVLLDAEIEGPRGSTPPGTPDAATRALDAQFQAAAAAAAAAGGGAEGADSSPLSAAPPDDAAGLSALTVNYAERWFVLPMIMTACGVSFAHGGNDIANAIGPLSEVLLLAVTGSLAQSEDATGTLWWVTPVGGLFIVAGLVVWGRKVMETVGEKITKLTFSKGFCAQFGAATAVLVATVLGMPISTTAVLIGAIAGVGAVGDGDGGGIDVKMVGKIVAGWVVTLPIAGGVSVAIFAIVRAAQPGEVWQNCTSAGY